MSIRPDTRDSATLFQPGTTVPAAILTIGLLLWTSLSAQAALGPENVAVVVNSRSWASRTIANYFIHLRAIPEHNVIYVDNNLLYANLESVNIDGLREQILTPVLQTLESRGVADQIDCIVYSTDLPFAVGIARELKEQHGKTFNPAPVGSINGMTYLYPLTLSGDPRYVNPGVNLYCRTRVLSTRSEGESRGVRMGFAPAMGFTRSFRFQPNGSVSLSGPGMRYMLSTVLGVTTGRGNSVSEVIQMLYRSVEADGTRPDGTIYYMANEDIRARTRAWGFEVAVKMLDALGVRASILPEEIPTNRPDVAGLMMGVAGFDWSRSGSTILPGAICEHLTSYGGALGERSSQTPLSEFIRNGAAGASGTVSEPLAMQSKFPTPLIHVYYASGCTLAEAFYQSIDQPFQLLIVGDPLCRPWARIPDVRVEDPTDGQTVSGLVTITPRGQAREGDILAGFALFVDGQFTTAARLGDPLLLDTRGLDEGHHLLTVVAQVNDPIQTRGRASLAIQVDNHGMDSLTFTRPEPLSPHPWGTPVQVEASQSEATRIEILHNALVVGVIEGSSGRVSIPTDLLGIGPVTLHAVAETPSPAGGTLKVRAEPIRVEVAPPVPLPPSAIAEGVELAPGAMVRSDSGETHVIAEPNLFKILKDAGIREGESFTVEGWFRAPETDIYQLQAFADMDLHVSIDGHEFDLPRRGWRFAPLSLQAGMHHLVISGKVDHGNNLCIRLGHRGARFLAGPWFLHARP